MSRPAMSDELAPPAPEDEELPALDYYQLREEWESVGRQVQDDHAYARREGHQRDGALIRENRLIALGNRLDKHAR